MVHFIANILSNRRFVLKFSCGQTSRPRTIKNGVSRGSFLAPMFFSIYLSDIPSTTSHQYGYADDLALFHCDKSRSVVENTLTKDTLKISDYLLKWKWRLKLNTTKTTTAFHLKNRFKPQVKDGSQRNHSTPHYKPLLPRSKA